MHTVQEFVYTFIIGVCIAVLIHYAIGWLIDCKDTYEMWKMDRAHREKKSEKEEIAAEQEGCGLEIRDRNAEIKEGKRRRKVAAFVADNKKFHRKRRKCLS